MNTSLTWLFLVGLCLSCSLFFGIFDADLDFLLSYIYIRYKTLHAFFLVRHDQSQVNIDRTLYTHMVDHNIELTEKDHKQAIETGKNITLINWSRIYLCLHEQEFGNLTDTNTNIERT